MNLSLIIALPDHYFNLAGKFFDVFVYVKSENY